MVEDSGDREWRGVDPRSPEIRLLGRCLAFSGEAAETAALRLALLGGNWDGLFAVADELRLAPALIERLSARALVPPIPARRGPGGKASPAAAVADRRAAHEARRKVLCERLDELVAALNRRGIEPILLKGARSLWTGRPAWRTLRDLDLLVPAASADEAQAIAEGLGYAPSPEERHHLRRHHLDPLFRADLPGWLEIHRRGGNPYAEAFLPTAELWGASLAATLPGRGQARLLPPVLHILHQIIHHHVAHNAYGRGGIDLKGLYEFAADLRALETAERGALQARAARHPRLVALIDLWLAAAADVYALPVEPPFAIDDYAVRRWRRIATRQDRTDLGGHPGYGEERRAAWHVVASGRDGKHRGFFARLAAKVGVVISLLPKPPN